MKWNVVEAGVWASSKGGAGPDTVIRPVSSPGFRFGGMTVLDLRKRSSQ